MDPFLKAALEEAEQGLRNRRVQKGSVTLHGEMDALENAGRQPAAVYRECTIYTTLSPCAMCSGAILLYGIPKVVIGENQTFLGEEDLLRGRGVSVEVVQDPACIRLMTEFIRANPALWNEDIGV
jgi:cytosine deaminase